MSAAALAWMWKEKTLKSSQRLMLLAIADRADDEGTCYPGIARLAEKCNCSIRNAEKLIAELERAGQLVIVVFDGIKTSGGFTNRYYMKRFRDAIGLQTPNVGSRAQQLERATKWLRPVAIDGGLDLSQSTGLTLSKSTGPELSQSTDDSLDYSLVILFRERLKTYLLSFEPHFGKLMLSEQSEAFLAAASQKLNESFEDTLKRCVAHGGKTWAYVLAALDNELRSKEAQTIERLAELSGNAFALINSDFRDEPKPEIKPNETVMKIVWKDESKTFGDWTAARCFDAGLNQLILQLDRNSADFFKDAQLVDYVFDVSERAEGAHYLTIVLRSEYAKQLATRLSRNFERVLETSMNIEHDERIRLSFISRDEWAA